MRKKRKVLIASGSALVAAAVVICLWPEGEPPEKPEPSYNATSLSEWLAACRPGEGPWDVGREAERAVRSIGTNALPFLLEWIRYELPPRRARLLRLATFHTGDDCGAKIVFRKAAIEGDWVRKAEMAGLGFVILNTNGALAIPQLEALMRNNRKPEVGLRAIYALGDIGGPAITALTNALADPKQTNRIEIMVALMGAERASPYYYGSAYTGASLPALNRALEDPDAEVRRQAATTLYNITNVTPRLLRAMHAPPPPL